MSKAVWKFPIPFPPREDMFTLRVPEGATPLTVQMQRGQPQLWALVDTDAPRTDYLFRIAGSGHPIDEVVQYIGTFQMASGDLVFHVFEVPL
jgi:hypothetical protein